MGQGKPCGAALPPTAPVNAAATKTWMLANAYAPRADERDGCGAVFSDASSLLKLNVLAFTNALSHPLLNLWGARWRARIFLAMDLYSLI